MQDTIHSIVVDWTLIKQGSVEVATPKTGYPG